MATAITEVVLANLPLYREDDVLFVYPLFLEQ